MTGASALTSASSVPTGWRGRRFS